MNYSGWFLDSGDLTQIKKYKPVIGGITTNQVILFEKEKIYNIPVHLKKIISLVGPKIPISVELPDSQASIPDMLDLASRYHQLSPDNIVIKVPIIPTSTKGLKILYRLAKKGIRANATIGINQAQLQLAAESLRHSKANGDNYISLFWGRAQESFLRGESQTPETVLTNTLTYLSNHHLSAKIIIGSIRQPAQVLRAFSLGAHIVTVPPSILQNIMFTTRAQETLVQFDSAYHNHKDNPKLKLI